VSPHLTRLHDDDNSVDGAVADVRALNERNLAVVLRLVADLQIGHGLELNAALETAADG